MGQFLRNLGEHLDDLILVVVFVLLPVLQRVFASLQKRRAAVSQSERARRDLETPPEPEPLSAPPEGPERGRDLWRELLEQVEEPPAAEAPPPAPAPAEPRRPVPVPTERPVKRARAAPTISGPLAEFEVEALGGLAPAPSEDELEGAAAAPRAPLASLQTLDVHEAVEPLAELPGLVPGDARGRAEAALAPRPAVAGVDWRRAIVLSEVLRHPVALRAPGSLAPGLGDLD